MKSSNLNHFEVDATNTSKCESSYKQGLCGLDHKAPLMLKLESEMNLVEFW